MISRITTIVPTDYLAEFEKCLRKAGVPGMTIDNVKGFGQHANYFSDDLLRSNVRIEVLANQDKCVEICAAIKSHATQSHILAGILVIESVDCLIDLNSGQEVKAESL